MCKVRSRYIKYVSDFTQLNSFLLGCWPLYVYNITSYIYIQNTYIYICSFPCSQLEELMNYKLPEATKKGEISPKAPKAPEPKAEKPKLRLVGR